MNLLGMAPNDAFSDLIDNEDLKLKLLLFSKISELSKDRIDFLLSIIDSFKFLK